MSDNLLLKVEILIQQNKFAEAEKILKNLLSEDSNNVHFLALLAEVNLQQDKFDSATSIINNAISLAPDHPHLFYIKARIAIQQDDYDNAEENIKQSIELDPFDADYFALLANLKLSRKQYDEALDFANKALEIDAENILGLNTRSSALLKLDKAEESFETIEGALREDPNNAYTHANYGWGLLEKGNHKKALVHFKESLKNDPNFHYAQAGMMEALKASNPIYKLFLQYSFWMSNMTAKYQWVFIIGFYAGIRVLRALANNNETLQPYLTPIIIALSLVAFSTWIMNPIGNLFLRFNTYGNLLLDKNEKASSNFVAASAGIFLVGVLLYFLFKEDKFLSLTFFGFAMMLPFSLMFSPSKYKNAFLIYAIIMAILGTLAIAVAFLTGVLFNLLSVIFAVGFIGFQWIANFLMIKENNK
ncbi:tetratricopeptide repeat protein [Pedobacter frigiditerrae]|uniref:Tetratricopeptide repeat protein n=1 Tax=Pedobacter frigiditerrae TaxID=2530452 RepID=A0A4R0N1A8_9SPHI|nr:tetratricopeptide repeat protein [Pedobacter frigiditerrae]TCC92122.1 tetratricopeptide repeat protein [Pedobacter frigiditerrae]